MAIVNQNLISSIVSMNSYLANYVLFVSKILLGYQEALWSNKFEISQASQTLTNEHQVMVLS